MWSGSLKVMISELNHIMSQKAKCKIHNTAQCLISCHVRCLLVSPLTTGPVLSLCFTQLSEKMTHSLRCVHFFYVVQPLQKVNLLIMSVCLANFNNKVND